MTPTHLLSEGLRPQGRGPGRARGRLRRRHRRLPARARLHARRGRRHHPARAGVRILLRRRAGGGVRLPDAPEVSRPAHLPRRRDHPQPARERASCARWAIEILAAGRRTAVRLRRASAPEDVVILPAFGVTIDDFEALRADRLRAGRHDVRLGAQRVEARRELRARRLHGADPRQVLPRGDARDGVAGREVPERRTTSSCATWTKRAMVCDYIEGRGRPRGVAREVRARRSSPGFDPDVHLQRIGVANQTTMLATRVAGDRRGGRRRRSRARAATTRARRDFRTLRHDLQRDAGAAGRRASSCSHEPLDVMVVIGGFNSSNTISLAALCADTVPTYHIEDAGGDRSRGGHDPLPSRRRQARRGRRARAGCRCRPGARRRHRGREHAEQQDRRSGGRILATRGLSFDEP